MEITPSILGVYLSRPLNVYQTRSLPPRLKLQDKPIGLFHKKTGGVLHSALLAVPWGVVVTDEELSPLLL